MTDTSVARMVTGMRTVGWDHTGSMTLYTMDKLEGFELSYDEEQQCVHLFAGRRHLQIYHPWWATQRGRKEQRNRRDREGFYRVLSQKVHEENISEDTRELIMSSIGHR
jgi:hypothetical protein